MNRPPLLPRSETTQFSRLLSRPHENPRPSWPGWLPFLTLPFAAISLRGILPPWLFMWSMAIAIFAGCKWQTWWIARRRDRTAGPLRSLAFLFLWPGMDADQFLSPRRPTAAPAGKLWLFACAKTLFGAALLWGGARLAGNGFTAAWIGMVGLIFLLHFGIFHLLALFWQRCGIDARPLMNWPLLARSLGDFWGKRWNAGFRDLAFGLWFVRLSRRLPPQLAALAVFVISGLIHELVISIPAGAGYGLPTSYFLLQGVGVLLERSRRGRSLRGTSAGRFFAIAAITLPVPMLFPHPFVLRVMAPFFQCIKALP